MFASLAWQGEIPAEVWGIGVGVLIIIIVAVTFSLILLGVSLYIMFKLLGRMRQNQALLTQGEPGQATILKVWDTGVTVNDNPQVGLLLEVRPAAAGRAPYQVETKCLVSRLKIPQVQTGAVVAVKYDSQDPTKIALDLV